jgi:hypothetical protein
MATSEQLEREAEATRAQIAATLDELRGRMTPGQIVDQLVDYARERGGGEFFRNFGRQVVGNPVPVTLVGAGLAWLMMAGRGGPPPRAGASGDDIAAGMSNAGRLRPEGDRSSGGTPASDDVAAGMSGTRRRPQMGDWFAGGVFGTDDVAAGMSDAGGLRQTGDQSLAGAAGLSEHAVRRAQQWAQQTRGAAAQVGESLQETAGEAGAAVRDTASAAYATAAERSRQGAEAVARGARSVGDSLASSGQGFLTLLREQPLVLAGLGLAIGSLLGAALPITETENAVMGEASDAAMREAKARAAEQVEKGKAVAAEAWDAAKPELEAQLAGHRQDAGSADRTRAASEAGQGATLVPSDKPADAAAEGTRREAGQPTE